VLSVRVFNEWGVATVRDNDGNTRKVTGSVVSSLEEGLSYEFRANERNHPTHGPTLEANSAQPTLDVDENAIIKFLAKTFDGVGLRKATAYLSAINADDPSGATMKKLRDALLHQPWKIDVEAVLSGAPRIFAREDAQEFAPAATSSSADPMSDAQSAAAAEAAKARKWTCSER